MSPRARGRMLFLLLIFSVVVACSGAADLGGGQGLGTSRAAGPEGLVWRTIYKCPINSMYILLRLYERPVRYEELEARLPVGQGGSNLTALRDCAAAYGLRTRVVKATPETLARSPLPAIAHCDEERTTGHYVVVLGITGQDNVHIIDGTTAVVSTQSLSDFRKIWSGYLLVADKRPWWGALFPVALGLGIVSGCLAVWDWSRRRHAGTRSSPQTGLPDTPGEAPEISS
jgi:hypothetical protein